MTAEKLLDALDSVVWYNGYGDIIKAWKEIEPDPKTDHILPLPNYGVETHNGDYEQLQVLWMVAVSLFGDYGTSPRWGWIEDVNGFRDWCDKILYTTLCAEGMDDE